MSIKHYIRIKNTLPRLKWYITITIQRSVKPVLNWANVSSRTVLVGSIRPSYIRGPKTLAEHVLGTFALLDDHCL